MKFTLAEWALILMALHEKAVRHAEANSRQYSPEHKDTNERCNTLTDKIKAFELN